MRFPWLFLFLCLFAWLPAALAAATAEEQLRRFLADTETLRAEFVQTRQQGAGVERAGGRLLLARPGRFRWDYREPYTQLILADGQRLWIYDPDLAQVTVKPQDQALGNSPARLLSGEIDLDRHFAVLDLGRREGLDWVELRASQGDDEFTQVSLAFAAGTLRLMRMVDNLGNITDIEFSELEINIPVDSNLFSFTPPAGVDVLGE